MCKRESKREMMYRKRTRTLRVHTRKTRKKCKKGKMPCKHQTTIVDKNERKYAHYFIYQENE